MSEIRQRKLRDEAPTSHPVRTRASRSTSRFQKIFLYLLIIMVLGCYVLTSATYMSNSPEVVKIKEKISKKAGAFSGPTWLDTVVRTFGYRSDHHYAVVIDAGSSGSRVLAYKFRVPFSLFGSSNLALEEEFFKYVKPGLSAFANEPHKGAETIVNLIKDADAVVPKDRRATTPLIIRATAGLRLLPVDKADALIESVKTSTANLGYDTSPGVGIMDGSDEGIYIWYTVNLLFNLLDTETMAALDLGGGSTQVTCEINTATMADYPKEDQYAVTHNKNITLYTHSYLKMGLYAAREGILDLESNNKDDVVSVCVDPIIKNEKWSWNHRTFNVSGAPRPSSLTKEAAFAQCYDVVRRYVRATAGATPPPPRGAVAAMSFYYDVAADAGIIDVMTGGVSPVSSYRGSAAAACSASNVEQPWACLDLVFVYALLNDLHRMPAGKQIHLLKQVDQHEVSWALGIAYTTIVQRVKHAVA